MRAFWRAAALVAAAVASASAESREVRQGGYQFINPLLECEMEESQLQSLKPLQLQLEKKIREDFSKRASRVAVYFRDLNNGPWFGINEKDEFSPASLLKVPLMMDYFRRAEADPSILQRKLSYDRPDTYNSSPYFPPSQVLRRGQPYTVNELIRRMIVHSDNDAFLLVISSTDPKIRYQTYRDLGIEVPGFRTEDDFMSVREYASFFRILFNASYLSKPMSEKALRLLSQAEFKQGIVAGVPAGVKVAHKFGDRISVDGREVRDPAQLHDCGIVYYPAHPYLLCVMTRGPEIQQLVSVIQDISRFVYQEIDRQHQKEKP